MKNGMKKLTLITTLLASMIAVPTASLAATPKPIDQSRLKLSLEVLVNARKVQFPDVKPMQKDNRILVPLRFVSDKLGGKLTLVGKDITIIKGDRTVNLTIGAKTATANGQTITLDVAANAVNGRTMVPLRFISEALGEQVKWDSLNQFVWIGSQEVPDVSEVVKASDLKPYLKYFNGRAGENSIETDTGKQFTIARVIGKQDFPVKIGEYIYYRIDRAYDTTGVEYIRFVSTEKSDLARPLELLFDGKPTRLRSDIYNFRQSKDGVRVQYYTVIDNDDLFLLNDRNFQSLRLKNVDYLGMLTPVDEAIIFKKDFIQ